MFYLIHVHAMYMYTQCASMSVSVFDIKDTIFIIQFNSVLNCDHVLSDPPSSVVIELS